MKKFKEKQRFRRWDIMALLAILLVGTLYRFIDLYVIKGVNDGYFYISIIGLIVLITAGILLWNLRLSTKINKKGIRFQFYPLHSRKQKINWEDVEDCEVEQHSLTSELSGWTVNIGSQEYTYSFYGRTGLHLRLKDGREFFLGTRHPEELRKTIEKITSKEEARYPGQVSL